MSLIMHRWGGAMRDLDVDLLPKVALSNPSKSEMGSWCLMVFIWGQRNDRTSEFPTPSPWNKIIRWRKIEGKNREWGLMKRFHSFRGEIRSYLNYGGLRKLNFLKLLFFGLDMIIGNAGSNFNQFPKLCKTVIFNSGTSMYLHINHRKGISI